jgi:hypothetical protein
MKTNTWLVRTALLALAGSFAGSAFAQATSQTNATSRSKSEDEEGPFAPKGKTGKLRDTTVTAAEVPHEPAPFPEKPSAAGVDLVFGFGKTGTLSAPNDVSVVSFIVGANYEFPSRWGVRLRVPFGTGKVTESGPAGGYNAAALGNVEIALERVGMINPRTRLPVYLAVALPTAGGDRFPPSSDPGRGHTYQVNVAEQASRGLEEDALFSTHRLGIVPGARLEYQRSAISAGGFAKVPVLIRVGGEDPPPVAEGQVQPFKINSVVVEGVAGGYFRYAILQGKIDFGLRAWVTYVANEPVDLELPGDTTPSKLQVALEPAVRGAFGRVRAGVGFIWPVGGRVAADQSIDGVRISAAYTF